MALSLIDPLKGRVNNLWDIVFNVFDVLIPALGILFIAMMIQGGVQYMMNNLDTDKVKGAQTTIKNAVIGFVIVVSSFVILRLVEKAIYG
jgi:TRAP-type C4-dicarboxylate transport system permease small subunit